MKWLTKTSLSLALALALGTSAQAKPFSELVALSGALSDTGNWTAEKGEYAPPLSKNKLTNGPAAIEVLARHLGLKAEPSLHIVGKEGGTNFAVADALASANGPHDLPGQVDAYLKRRGGKVPADALIFLFNGGNDVILAVQTMDDAKSEALIQGTVDGIERQIRRLSAAGAKTIFAPDFIDVGLSPLVRKFGPEAVARSTKISDDYNKRFNAMLDRLEKENLPFELIRFSFDKFVKDLVAHGDEFGLNVTDACTAAPKCDPDKYVFLTEEYPSAKVHEMLGTALAYAIMQRPVKAVKGN